MGASPQREAAPVASAQALAAAQAELRELASQRAAADREGDRTEVLLRAIAQTRRDRDAATSAPLLRHRAVFEQMLADLDELAVTITRLAMRATLAGGDENRPEIRAARVAGQRGLDALQRMGRALSGAGAKG